MTYFEKKIVFNSKHEDFVYKFQNNLTIKYNQQIFWKFQNNLTIKYNLKTLTIKYDLLLKFVNFVLKFVFCLLLNMTCFEKKVMFGSKHEDFA